MNPCPVDATALEALGVSRLIPVTPGMSGAQIFRCAHSTGAPLILRVWAPELAEPRLSEITRLVTVIHSELPSLVPRVFPLEASALSEMLKPTIDRASPTSEVLAPSQSVSQSQSVRLHGNLSMQALWGHSGARYWQLFDEMPGDPLPVDAEQKEVMAGVDALSRLHGAMSWFGQRREMPLAIRSRLKRLDQVHEILGVELTGERALRNLNLNQQFDPRKLPDENCQHGTNQPSEGIQDTGKLTHAISNAISIWNQNAVRMKKKLFLQLTTDSSAPMPTQYVLRDIHRENLLFDKGQASGFFDFDAVRVDTPWADLARWVGSFVVHDQAEDSFWLQACERFAATHSVLGSEDVTWGHGFAKRLHEATQWISLGNWLVWLCIEQRSFSVPNEVLAKRISRLAASVVSKA